MERIQVDFAMQRGHEMILRRDPPFVRPELDEVDMRMLQSAPPPGLLAVDWFELDGDITFRYAIGGRKLLTHRLISGPFGMNEYVSFLLGVVEALDNCGHHLLRESCCLLEEKFLFVGEDWRDAALVYLPLRDPPAKKPVREELLGLAVRLIGKSRTRKRRGHAGFASAPGRSVCFLVRDSGGDAAADGSRPDGRKRRSTPFGRRCAAPVRGLAAGRREVRRSCGSAARSACPAAKGPCGRFGRLPCLAVRGSCGLAGCRALFAVRGSCGLAGRHASRSARGSCGIASLFACLAARVFIGTCG